MNKVLREATAADCEMLAAFINAAYRGDSSRQGWTTEADLLDGQRTDVQSLRQALGEPNSVILLLLHDDKLVGSVPSEPKPILLPRNADRQTQPTVRRNREATASVGGGTCSRQVASESNLDDSHP